MNIFCAFSSVFLTISTIFTGRRFDSVRLGKDRFAKSPMRSARKYLHYSENGRLINIGPKD
ncbi:hypothetical protein Alfi_0497 [Alistipes finegoldii DSM 17242]|uniref:Uncharacterized protein n=1 Tax=Alistipes finegoldii (strain DSM 17242 / JCM 16770 / CCUG 46020 / CIP 107999 / KCTC 15236 / AHN 2437) TaxID=679935 RepID=I3YIS3_ALIFI|nr:hypothetical protein Alfi_0497 [Alistipes finegoldii DSM 17242]CCZ75824.1 uncharacterized protein BN754_01415 [Alistipes finegoldii CAG:68]